MSLDRKQEHRWHIQVQRGQQDWRTIVDCASPVTKEEFAHHEGIYSRAPHGPVNGMRVLHVVTTTHVERTLVDPVDAPKQVPA